MPAKVIRLHAAEELAAEELLSQGLAICRLDQSRNVNVFTTKDGRFELPADRNIRLERRNGFLVAELFEVKARAYLEAKFQDPLYEGPPIDLDNDWRHS